MKSNVVLAAMAGLILGVVAELFFAFVDNIPLIGCLFTPVALLFGLGLPLLVGAFAVMFAPSRELTAPLDGALAATLAELVSRLIGFCASIFFVRSFFFGPRFLLPSVEPATRALFSGVWAIGWLVVSLAVAAILGAIGAAVYALKSQRQVFAAMWRALTRPSLTAFEQARADAHLGRALIAALVVGAATGFIGGLINFISASDSIIEALTLAIVNPFRLVFALIIVNAILFSAARAFGGRGDFATQTYLGALVFIPINALASLLAAIPTIGAFLALAVLMYGVVVNVWALRAAHSGRAWQISNIVLLIISLMGGIIGWVAMSSISQ